MEDNPLGAVASARWSPLRAFRSAFAILRDHRRPHFVLNVLYFLLVACGMVFAHFHRDVQQSASATIEKDFASSPLLAPADKAYKQGRFVTAVVLTFAVNLFIGSLLFLTLPSLIVPFGGIALGALRAVVWGVIFWPLMSAANGSALLLSGLMVTLMLLEGEAYLIVLLGCYVHGKAFLRPASVGATGHVQGYWRGLKQSLQLYWLVVVQLAIAALYEVTLATVILPRLK